MHREIAQHVLQQLTDLEREAAEVYRLVDPIWSHNQTLYGYVSRTFSFVDLLSAYWRGNDAQQSRRMVDFLEQYVGGPRRVHSISVQVWRHKLTHTAEPRYLLDQDTNRPVTYLLHWHNDLMGEVQAHGTTLITEQQEILNIAALSLIADVRRAATRFFEEVETSPVLQANVARYKGELDSDTLRDY